MSYYTSDILSFLLEAEGENIDSGKDNEKADLDADKKDTKSTAKIEDDIGKESTDDDTNSELDTGEETESALDDMESSGDGDPETSDSSNDNDETTSPPHEEESKSNGEKLLLYTALKELKTSFEGTLSAFEIMISTPMPEGNDDTFKRIKKKIQVNINLLDDFLNDIDDIKVKSLKDLKAIYTLYRNDLRMIENVLKSHSLSNKK